MLVSVVLLLTPVPPPPDLPWGGNDFVQYYVGAELLQDGRNPYDRAAAESRQKAYGRDSGVATYAPPWGLLPALTLAWLPFQQAVVVNIALNAALLTLCAAAWTSLLFPGQPRLITSTFVALPLWMPCLAVIGIGQLSLWPLAGFTGWLWLTARGKHVPASLVLVLTVIKPHLGLLPGLFVAARWVRRRQLLPALTFLVAFAALTALTLWLRPAIWAEYVQALQEGATPGQVRSATLDGWGRETLGHGFRFVSWTLWGGALFLAVLSGWRLADRDKAFHLSSTLICVAAVAAVPYAFSFDFVFLLPGFLLAVGRMLTNASYWRGGILAWLALEAWMVAGKLAPWEEMAYWFVPWLGLAATAWLVVLHRRGIK